MLEMKNREGTLKILDEQIISIEERKSEGMERPRSPPHHRNAQVVYIHKKSE